MGGREPTSLRGKAVQELGRCRDAPKVTQRVSGRSQYLGDS